MTALIEFATNLADWLGIGLSASELARQQVADPRCPSCGLALEAPLPRRPRCPSCGNRAYVVAFRDGTSGLRWAQKVGTPHFVTRERARAFEAERLLERQRAEAQHKVYINLTALKSGFET